MIELDDVFVLYPCLDRQVAALRGLTLSIAAGERVVITGPSGSGKSTLVKLVTGQVRPSAGRATILDHDLAIASPQAIFALQRKGVGTITQQMTDNLAVELSVLQNVSLQSRLAGTPGPESQRLALEMLERLGLASIARRTLRTVSAGESQRVAIAAALAHRPRIIVADEPTGALDLSNAHAVFDLLVELSVELEAALLVVSHDPGAARVGQRVLEIRDGRLGSEVISGTSQVRLVVDERGWVRLPEPDRLRSGITTRAVVGPTDAEANDARAGGVASVLLHAPLTPAALARPPSANSTETATRIRHVLTAEAVSFRVGDTTVLSPTSLHINSGELTVIAGRSGSGKTTLLSLLAGFTQPTSGHIERTSQERPAVAASGLGFAESMSVSSNIELACAVRGQTQGSALANRIMALLHHLDIADLAERPLNTLSGGERQRVSVARTLASDATLVLFDEPTSQLDQGFAHLVAGLLLDQARSGRAIVCAAHEPELITKADRVHTLDEFALL